MTLQEVAAFVPDLKSEEREWEGITVAGPRDLAMVLQARAALEEAEPFAELGTPTPADIVLWSLGEPDDRAVTKVGGLPYMPCDMRWPLDGDGQPMKFLAQFCFADSTDLVGDDLPGDILLLFVAGDGDSWLDYTRNPSETYCTEWVTIDPSHRLVSRGECGADNRNWRACYGNLVRLDERSVGQQLYEAWVAQGGHRDGPDRASYIHFFWLDTLHATKIGGLETRIQEPLGVPGRRLCSLAHISPSMTRPWSFVNFETTLDRERIRSMQRDAKFFSVFDLGAYSIHYDPETSDVLIAGTCG